MRRIFTCLALSCAAIAVAVGCEANGPTEVETVGRDSEAGTPLLKRPDNPSAPKNVAFLARLEDEVSAVSTLTIPFDDVTFNHGDAYDPGTGVFTAPLRGVYLFSAPITHSTQSTATTGFATVQFAINGAEAYSIVHADPAANTAVSPSITIILEAGDEVTVVSRNNLNALQEVLTGYFSGHLVYGF
jgi:hypothetical protein